MLTIADESTFGARFYFTPFKEWRNTRLSNLQKLYAKR